MSAATGWITTVLLVYGAVFVLLHMGFDVGGTIGTALASVEHMLSQPIVP
jgi:predicted TIM-barrel enzyme